MTIEEIEKLTEYQKNVFVTKEDNKTLEDKIDKIQTTLDGFAKTANANKQEITVLNHRMKASEDWIDKASPKLDLEFKH